MTDKISDPGQHQTKKLNRLRFEKSLYLLQHASNPVDWYPWGDEAFEKAKKEDKPIFLSIGYSTCHWCHVMEQESFEDSEMADVLNDVFICIKVDREERPDIDQIYMTVCQLMTGSGGWPLTIFMTPDKKPFFAGTYLPKENRFGRTGLYDLSLRVRELWRQNRQGVLEDAERLTTHLQSIVDQSMQGKLDKNVLHQAYDQLANRFDSEYGGFGVSPKFPSPHNLQFLLRYWKRTGNEKALIMVEKTLQAMRQGGIYDHVGFGFHRYATDQEWLVPHFEKMLYDQAMLVMAYSETYQATRNDAYKQVAEEVLTYVLRDMTDDKGGFYSAEDADSEGEEGKFYVWTEKRIREVLTDEEADFVIKAYNVHVGGNYIEEGTQSKTGKNILHLKKSISETAARLKLDEDAFTQKWHSIRKKLYAVREKTIHPMKDDKVLTDWNGLMITAMAKAGKIFDEPDYIAAAEKSVRFILSTLRDTNGRLVHQYRDGVAAKPSHLDDYAFLVWGLLELYEATFKTEYLLYALELTEDMIKYFGDDDGAFFFTASDSEVQITRMKGSYDGAIPSGNSVAAMNLLRLSRMTGRTEFEKRTDKLINSFAELLNQSPIAHTNMLQAIDFAKGPAFEIVIAGRPDARRTESMIDTLRMYYIPNKVVLFRSAREQHPELIELAEVTRERTALDGQTAVYVCQDFKCNLPTEDVSKMLELLGVPS